MIRTAVNNSVATNILMFAIIVCGLAMGLGLRRELLPSVTPNIVSVRTVYEGAAPEEVERGVTARIEEAIREVDGIKEVRSTSAEGMSLVLAEIHTGEDLTDIAEAIRREVEALTTLPSDAERPIIAEQEAKFPVLTVVVRGNVEERQLHETAESVKDELLSLEMTDAERRPFVETAFNALRAPARISDVIVTGARKPEIAIELSAHALAAHGLTPQDVAAAIARANRDRPGGTVTLENDTLIVRTLGERTWDRDLADIPIKPLEGGILRVGDVAVVKPGFKDVEAGALFAGERAASLTIFKSERDDAIRISDRVRTFVIDKNEAHSLPAGVRLEATADLSVYIQQRMDLLTTNALQGFVLVFISLILFLNFRVAFWVAMGLPVALLGTMVVLNWLGESINMISMFGLIIVIGILVDDGIVIGENIWSRYERGEPPRIAAVRGTKEVVLAVMAALTTTVAAFIPLGFIAGRIGDFLGVIPVIVVVSLLVSTVEAFLILPSHLADTLPPHRSQAAKPKASGVLGVLFRPFVKFWEFKERLLNETLRRFYEGLILRALRWRYLTQAVVLAMLIAGIGLVQGGIVPFLFFPDIDSDRLTVTLEMATGTPGEVTREHIRRMDVATRAMPDIHSCYALWGGVILEETATPGEATEEVGQLVIELKPAEERTRHSSAILAELRERIGVIPGANKLLVKGNAGGPAGADIELQLVSPDGERLTRAIALAREELVTFEGVRDIEDTLKRGKQEIRLRLKPSAAALGISEADVAAQIRGRLFGAKAQTLQRGRDEVDVYVRLPESERGSFSDLESTLLRTPDGRDVPLVEAVDLMPGRGLSNVSRIDQQRAATLRASVDHAVANPDQVQRAFEARVEERLAAELPGVKTRFVGRKYEMVQSMSSLMIGFPIALIGIYIVLAVLFKSYLQPLVVMVAIPFGFIGALLGHWVMGLPLSILSMIGLVALSGIVVNDSSVLVDFINTKVRQGWKLHDAIVASGGQRLRAILLTTITTALGLAPLMMQTSFQAQFLIPMATSLVYGLCFATVLTLVMVPTSYAILADVVCFFRWLRTGRWEYPAGAGHQVTVEEEILPEERMHETRQASGGNGAAPPSHPQ